MDLAHAFLAQRLADHGTTRLTEATPSELAAAEFRAVTRARRRAERAAAAASARGYTERGRHRAPAQPQHA
ncbi:hypothetical protein FLP10_14645 [Agromyces intestinalis]|uniref:Uncharacterized protein n=1 Tax=Agromyces intestinalis TaxID=2592652 RepID=A0A5C1YL51_9MICO|nr:hypothetical protein [Agromyces intestinalis]QEO15532.1 hypothetical protein FLP10_14645 [Agromyces intestinalis]